MDIYQNECDDDEYGSDGKRWSDNEEIVGALGENLKTRMYID